jgi:hypothetical protein
MNVSDFQQHELERMTDADLLTLHHLLYERLTVIERQTSAEYVEVSARLTDFLRERAERRHSVQLSSLQTDALLVTLYLGFQGRAYCFKVFKQHLWMEQLRSGENISFEYAIDASDAYQAYNSATELWNFDALARLVEQYEWRRRAGRGLTDGR